MFPGSRPYPLSLVISFAPTLDDYMTSGEHSIYICRGQGMVAKDGGLYYQGIMGAHSVTISITHRG